MDNQDTTEALKSSPVVEFAAGAVGIDLVGMKPGEPGKVLKSENGTPEWVDCAPQPDPVSEPAQGAEAMKGNRPCMLELPPMTIRTRVRPFEDNMLPEWAKGLCVPPSRGGTGKTTLQGRRPVKEAIAALVLLALALCIAFAVCAMVGK